MPRASIFFRAMILLLSFPPMIVLADAGHVHGNQSNGVTAPAHWMAPEEASRRPNPLAADRESLERGRKLFKTNCTSCHGPEARGDGPAGATLNPRPADLRVMAGQHPDGDFAWKIAEGRGAMPAWKKVFKDKQIWDLVNYIQDLAKPRKDNVSGDGHPHDHQH